MSRMFGSQDVLAILTLMQSQVEMVRIGREPLTPVRRCHQLEEVDLSKPGQEIIMNPGTEYRIVMEESPTS